MRDYTYCSFCEYETRNQKCKKGWTTFRIKHNSKGEKEHHIGPEHWPCKDYKELSL